jgi:RNA polymerase sigma-70 factor (ECF subfamily)
MSPVSANRHDNGDRHERAAVGTLGELLYADASKRPVPEAEWVELVQRIGHGDEIALHALFDRMQRPVFTLAMRISGNRQSAEEITLDVFHEIWRRASRYDAAHGTVAGWVMNQARSRAIDRVRFEQRKKRTCPRGNDDEPQGTLVASPDGQTERRRLQAAMERLSAEERQAIETAYFSDMTYAEVAALLNQPLGTIKTRIRSGLAKLRNAVAEG